MDVSRKNTFLVNEEGAVNVAVVFVYELNGIALREINRNSKSVLCKVRAEKSSGHIVVHIRHLGKVLLIEKFPHIVINFHNQASFLDNITI